ncbi:hypothetical protein N836_20990 [Leptolyngbya sp. Heron Island J]|uniref:DUF3110 domain-containing protein n=1 Tax=Leptolyngbya sp. Heron Island J TaxID=1385935 RepID=UPI0003B97AA2|nr:DUF3110 domain-containing protein [Leptolyngbya sp. Heron Island J]ESA33649.1 hypothetical protein N836_20990 [Leptolyngbya sp. Heron Island J]
MLNIASILLIISFILLLPTVFYISGLTQACLAYLAGDNLAIEKGYFSFPSNLRFAFGRSPEIDLIRIRSRIWRSIIPLSGLVMIALFILAISSPFWLGLADNWEIGAQFVEKTAREEAMMKFESLEWRALEPVTKWQINFLWPILAIMAGYLILLFLLLLLPLPGFSGYAVISPWLPASLQNYLAGKEHLFGLFVIAVVASLYFSDLPSLFKISANIANDQLKIPISAVREGMELTKGYLSYVWPPFIWSLVFNPPILSFTHPGQVFILLMNPHSSNEGIYTTLHADGRNTVLMFENFDDANSYNDLLSQKDLKGLSVEKINRWEVERFSRNQGHMTKLIKAGTQVEPAENNAETDFLR